MSSDFIDIIEDGGVQRKLLEEGEGDEAYDQCRVKLYLKGWVEDGAEFENNYDEPKPKKFRVESGLKSQGLNLGLNGMKKGEKAIIRIQSKYGFGVFGDKQRGIQPDATLLYEVKIVDLKPPKKKRFQMSVQEKNQKALKFRGYGSMNFKEKQYEEAKKNYKTALEYVQPIDQDGKELQVSLYLNQSILSYTLQEYKDSIDYGMKALNINSNIQQKVKAHYRCAQAQKQIGELEKAQTHIKDAIKLDQNNQLLIEELQIIKQLIAESDKRAKQTFAGMFNKNVYMYEDKISKKNDQKDEVQYQNFEDDSQKQLDQDEIEVNQEIQQNNQNHNEQNLETQASEQVIDQDTDEKLREKKIE